jgi:S1-C subfamily serine protease
MRGQYRSTPAADEWMAVRAPSTAPPRYTTGVAVAPDPVTPVTAPAYPVYPVTAVPAWGESVAYPRPPQWRGYPPGYPPGYQPGYPPISAPPQRSRFRTARRLFIGLLLFSLAPLLGLGAFLFVFNAQPTGQNGKQAAHGPQVNVPIGPSAEAASPAPSASLLSPAQVVAKVNPAVVNITVRLGNSNTGKAGTGIVLSSDGLVLTSNHVISAGTQISAVDVGNGRTFAVSVVGFDRSHDIALLKLRNASNLKKIAVAKSAAVKVGDGVVALGNAGGEGGTPKASAGKVTALDQTITATEADGNGARRLTGMIEVNAEIKAGDSGGPLVNRSGQLIGVNTAATDEKQAEATGVAGYAVPSDTALGIVAKIEDGQATDTVHIGQTALLGVSVGDAKGRGAAVTGIVPDGPAQDAGLRTGDLITAVDGQPVESPDDLTASLDKHQPGDQVQVEWTDRNGRDRRADVELASGPAG